MRKASIRQIRALQLISQGYSKRKAMIQAGYSISTANQATRAMETASMQDLTASMREELVDAGLTVDYVASKAREWFEAKKVIGGKEVPDYAVQIAAYDRWKIIMDYQGERKFNLKRKLTVEEFIMGDEYRPKRDPI